MENIAFSSALMTNRFKLFYPFIDNEAEHFTCVKKTLTKISVVDLPIFSTSLDKKCMKKISQKNKEHINFIGNKV